MRFEHLLAVLAVACASGISHPDFFPYKEPLLQGAFFDQFQYEDLTSSGWTPSSLSKSDGAEYLGLWEIAEPYAFPGLIGDKGLVMNSTASHYAILKKLPLIFKLSEGPLVLQYEVKPQQSLVCSGAYVKLILGTEYELSFSDNTPYEIMFGPDRCHDSNRVHFIVRRKNPISGKIEEKHMTRPPLARTGKVSTLYTLIFNGNGDYDVRINGKSARLGNVLNDEEFSPSFTPSKFIPDLSAEKPEDWDDREFVSDPDSPEDAPEGYNEKYGRTTIDDPLAVKPADWDEDQQPTIPDPQVMKPNYWDDEEDGVWEAPIIPNPRCVEGLCGPWKAPQIPNPDYKGIWVRPVIKNPDYQGEWVPPRKPNPLYYEEKTPIILNPITALGIEVWAMDEGLLFDNLYLGHSVEEAEKIGNATFSPKLTEEHADLKVNARAKNEPVTPPGSFDDLLGENFESMGALEMIKAFVTEEIGHILGLYSQFMGDPINTIIAHPIEFVLYCVAFVFLFTFVFGMLSLLLFLITGPPAEVEQKKEVLSSEERHTLKLEEPKAEQTGRVTRSGARQRRAQ